MTVDRLWTRLRRIASDERATSDVEYILLTATVVFMLFVIPPMIILANQVFFRRMSLWINLPFP